MRTSHRPTGRFPGQDFIVRGDLLVPPGTNNPLTELLHQFTAYIEKGSKLREEGDVEGGEAEYLKAAKLCPEAWLGMAGADLQGGDLKRAFDKCSQVYELTTRDKTKAAALNNMGMILTRWNRRVEALDLFQKAFALDPSEAGQAANIATILKWMGKVDEAIAWCEKALRIDPLCHEAAFGKAIALLLKGDLRAGFSQYETRWRNRKCKKLEINCPEWNGEPLYGKSMLVYTEQGVGDTIQMLRYFPRLRIRGSKIYFACAQGVRRLVERMGIVEEVIEDERLIPTTDYCIPTMSLPRVFGTTLDTIPAAPYLEAVHPCEVVPHAKLRVGLVWAGSADHVHDSLRSVPLESFRPLWGIDGVEFVSLQVGPGEVDLLGFDLPIETLPKPADFLDTAEQLRNIDLLVSIDTSVVHLAGAMGFPTWLLTPFAPDWRWMLGREDSPWYMSVRLFRQEVEGDWGPVMARIRKELIEARNNYRNSFPPGRG